MKMYKGMIAAVVLMGLGYAAGCYSVFALPKADAMTIQKMDDSQAFQNLVKRINQLPIKGKSYAN